MVVAEFPDRAGKLGEVADEIAVGGEGKPRAVLAGPVVLADPDAAVAADHHMVDGRKEVGHGTVVADAGGVVTVPVNGGGLAAIASPTHSVSPAATQSWKGSSNSPGPSPFRPMERRCLPVSS